MPETVLSRAGRVLRMSQPKPSKSLRRDPKQQSFAERAARIQAANPVQARPAPANVKPMSAAELRKVRATVIANAALKQVGPDVRKSARQAPSAEVSGALALGPNLYRKLGGDVQHPSLPEKGSTGWTALEAAGLLPFGRPLRALPAGVKAAKALLAGKTAAEAGTAAKETYRASGPIIRAAKNARASRSLRLSEKAQQVLPAGRVTETLIEKPAEPPLPMGAEKIFEALPEARTLRRQQEALYSAERGKRAGMAEQAMQVGGREGYLASLRQLKGELPKLKFGALEQFDQAAVDGLFSHVQRHPSLRPYEKIGTQTALEKVLGGGVPTRSEIKLLERTFGPEVATQLAESVPFWSKAKNLGLSLINVPRSLRASYDLSAPFRQGLVLGARHPRMFSREFAPMVKSFRSEGAYKDVMDDIASRPTFATMQKAKLQLTDLEGLSTREEQFMSNLAESIPVIGRGVRASGRAYTAFLNKFRADAFDNYLVMAEKQGLDIDDPVLLKSIARWVNHATGRGTLKNFEGAMVPLNALLFSPRLIMSRLQLLSPGFYLKLDPFARKQAVQGMTQLLGGISLTLYLAHTAGAEVGLDPRSSDFGKIKVGDTRVDIAGGFQQYIVAATRFVKGKSVSSTTGKVTSLTEGGFAKPSRADILARFAENKLAPVPSYITDILKNENFAGDKPKPLKEAGRMFLPLGLENAYEGFTVGGPGAGAASLGLSSVGFGVQTYRAKPASSAGRSKSLRAGQAGGSKSLRRTGGKSQSLRSG